MTEPLLTIVPPWRDRPMRTTAIAEARRAVQAARQHLLALLRDEVLWRDGPTCHYCSIMTVPATGGHGGDRSTDRTVDHKVPVDRGGRDELDNLVLCCRSCNARKGTLPYEVFLAQARPVRIHVLGMSEQYLCGQRVQHAVFGEGIVVSARDNTIVVVFGSQSGAPRAKERA